mgnify:CR=1 FL=1
MASALLPQFRHIHKLDHIPVGGVGLEDNDLIGAGFQHGGRAVEGLLGACVIVVPAQVEAVDHNKAMVEAVQADEGILGLALDVQRATEERGLLHTAGAGFIADAGQILHFQGIHLPAVVVPLAEADAGHALSVPDVGTVVDAAHVLHQDIHFNFFAGPQVDADFVLMGRPLVPALLFAVDVDDIPAVVLVACRAGNQTAIQAAGKCQSIEGQGISLTDGGAIHQSAAGGELTVVGGIIFVDAVIGHMAADVIIDPGNLLIGC